jgi:hypothetical protein
MLNRVVEIGKQHFSQLLLYSLLNLEVFSLSGGAGSGLQTCVCYDAAHTMAKPPRFEFPGAFHHIIVRGNQKQEFFVEVRKE